MVKFIPASELKARYDVFGHFYSVQLARQEIIHCRSVLELISNTKRPGNIEAISERKPDAVFIMMNPGSSQPLVEVNHRVPREAIQGLPISLVPTKPDTTQYQVMRLMHYREWHHVRVLNLSDLRCTKSPEFIKQFQRLEQSFEFDAHSIFAASRRRELKMKLSHDKRLPLVYAWGLSEQLNPLIERCLAALANRPLIYGLRAEAASNKYRHPLPTLQKDKLHWVQKMVESFSA